MSVHAYFAAEAVPDVISTHPYEKLAATAADWRSRFDLVWPSVQPADPDLIKLAHDPAHVDGILAGSRRNGLGNRMASVARSALWDVGAFVAAARDVASGRARSAAVVGGAFHHARWAYAHAFCTFNGLVVATVVLRREGLARRVGILDLDHHFGDGTHSCVEALGLHDAVDHYSFSHQMLDRQDVDRWLDGLAGVVRDMKAGGAEVVFYQAGMDPHVDDPVARGVMTTEQLRRRDRIVFETCAQIGLPVAWVLAGGYQKPIENSVALYRAAMEECLAAFG